MQQQLRVDKLVMDQQLFSRVESGAKKQSNYFFFFRKRRRNIRLLCERLCHLINAEQWEKEEPLIIIRFLFLFYDDDDCRRRHILPNNHAQSRKQSANPLSRLISHRQTLSYSSFLYSLLILVFCIINCISPYEHFEKKKSLMQFEALRYDSTCWRGDESEIVFRV